MVDPRYCACRWVTGIGCETREFNKECLVHGSGPNKKKKITVWVSIGERGGAPTYNYCTSLAYPEKDNAPKGKYGTHPLVIEIEADE